MGLYARESPAIRSGKILQEILVLVLMEKNAWFLDVSRRFSLEYPNKKIRRRMIASSGLDPSEIPRHRDGPLRGIC